MEEETPILLVPSTDPAACEEVHDHQYQRDEEEEVNEAAGDMGEQADGPTND